MKLTKQVKYKLLLISVVFVCSLIFGQRQVEANDSYQLVNVIIDGETQIFSEPAVIIDGNTMVPMRGVFEALGAKIDWDIPTQTATATKDDMIIILTIGNQIAYINGNAAELTVKPIILNGSTLVPLRFVSEVLGSKVDWDPKTYTASITSQIATTVTEVPTPTPSIVAEMKLSQEGDGYTDVKSGIEIRHGNHTYGVSNQEEYNALMQRVETELEKIPNMKPFEGYIFSEYYLKFLDGVRADTNDREANSFNTLNWILKSIESTIGDLASNSKISKEEIIKVFNIASLGESVIQEAKIVLEQEDLGGLGEREVYSAYHLMKGLNTNDSSASTQWLSALFDQAGYNTMIYHKLGKKYLAVEIGNRWYMVSGTFFTKNSQRNYTYSEISENLQPDVDDNRIYKNVHTHPTFKQAN